MSSALQKDPGNDANVSVVGQVLVMGKHRERATRVYWLGPVVGVGRRVDLKAVRCP